MFIEATNLITYEDPQPIIGLRLFPIPLFNMRKLQQKKRIPTFGIPQNKQKEPLVTGSSVNQQVHIINLTLQL